MIYVKFNTYTGEENMQIDSDLLDKAISKRLQEPIFRLYAWSPKCVSLGRNQAVNEQNFTDIDVVRRITGGRALLHDDEITYSYISPVSIIPNGETVKESYKYISGILINFFKTLGVELDFGSSNKINSQHNYCMLISTGADVCYKGKKIIGSAQYRKNGYILQHGSILFSYDNYLLEKLFGEKVSNESITTVKEILPNMTKDKFVSDLERYLKTKYAELTQNILFTT